MTNSDITDLRDSLSLSRLDIDLTRRIITRKPSDELETGLLAMIEILKRYYLAKKEEDFNSFIKKRTTNKVVLQLLIRLLPEFSADEIPDELILKIVTTTNGLPDTDKFINLISNERKARLKLRQIEEKIVQEYLTMTPSEFDLTIKSWEDNERNSLDLYLKTLDFIMKK
ncbi:MAG: hypothetical protein JNJ75_06495 [Cyclobacteriaceae bacterium]|nr:hypothetical protein [Cyclobacteriaceae bacterium]